MKKLVSVLALLIFAVGCGSAQLPDTDAMAANAEKKADAEKAEMEAGAEEAAKEATKLDVVDTALAQGTFNTLTSAFASAELVETLKGEGPYTLFAPTDEAFQKLSDGTVANLLLPENKEKLIMLLQNHIVPSKVMKADVATMEADTLAKLKVKVEVAEDGSVTFGGANVTATDLDCTNGVIHTIDTVVMPVGEVAAN